MYHQPVNGWEASWRFNSNKSNLSENEHKGKLSLKAKRKIEKAIYWMLYKTKVKYTHDPETNKRYRFHVNFITLTLPSLQIHSDSVITNKVFGNFLEIAKKKYGLTRYVWKAESQRHKGFDMSPIRNIGILPYRIRWFGLTLSPRITIDAGNIHYHVLGDVYIDKMELRKTWNQCTELLGYLSRFEKKHRHHNPNSTDVHSVKHIRKLASYVACYMSKNQSFECIGKLVKTGTGTREILYGSEELREVSNINQLGKVVGSILGEYHRPITSRLWGCSRELSQCRPIQIKETYYEWSNLVDMINQGNFQAIQCDRATILNGRVSTIAKKYYPELFELLQSI